MDDDNLNDKGGRRFTEDRRACDSDDPVPENRTGQDRRCGSDRRDKDDPVIRITGDERRKALRNFDIF